MSKNNKQYGISLIELVMACLITGILTLSAAEMLGGAFDAQIGHNRNIRAKQHKNILTERISSIIREGSRSYYREISLIIPVNGNSYTVQPEINSLAVLIPKFNTDGTLVQPSSGYTTFRGVAFSIIPQDVAVGDSADPGVYAIVETRIEFDLATKLSDPISINDSLPSDWTNGNSYILAKELKPAIFTNLDSEAFYLEGNRIKFAFVPDGGNLYFPSENGSINIDDGKYLTGCHLRNFRF
ncbi:MAG: type II secretion system protein [bacterium]